MYKLYGVILDHVIHNLKFFLGKRNYIFFCIFKYILIVDRKFQVNIFKIRNFYDYITVREVFLLQCYQINHLVKYNDIIQTYEKIINNNKIPLIIDCGSNIGASTVYFSKIFSKAHIVSIEPDKNNFEYLKKNSIKKNITYKLNAISSENKNFEISRPSDDPRAYVTNFKEDGNIKSITVNEILNEFKNNKYEPLLIKIDIEGSESDLFKTNVDWIDKFKVIIIEPHDWMYPKRLTFKNFLQKIFSHNRDFIILNENIISIRNS